jgi:hypothetical protein
MHAAQLVAAALSLAAAGANNCEISRRLGVPRTTVRDWVRGRPPRRGPRRVAPLPDLDAALSTADQPAYCYVLGLYLGDGDLTIVGGSARLRISLDSRYPGLIESASTAIGRVVPDCQVRLHSITGANLIVVACYSPSWRVLLPQHGPGPKYMRDVSLEGWQRQLTERYPESFIRGLIHSDGCRFVARQRSKGRMYEYPRYGFSNRSSDILHEFCDHLDLLGIHWTQANGVTIQIARRDAVARMDEFVGPKR